MFFVACYLEIPYTNGTAFSTCDHKKKLVQGTTIKGVKSGKAPETAIFTLMIHFVAKYILLYLYRKH